MSKSWKHAIIAFIVVLAIGSIGVYFYRDRLIIEAVEYGLSAEMDVTKGLSVDDFANVQQYTAECQNIELYYEEELFKSIAESYWTTPEHVEKVYINYIENKVKD